MTIVFYIVCIAVGGAIGYAAGASFSKRRQLPPATRKQLARAARANRADLARVRISRHDPLGRIPSAVERFENETTEDIDPPRAA